MNYTLKYSYIFEHSHFEVEPSIFVFYDFVYELVYQAHISGV